jgi:hypothetical protein
VTPESFDWEEGTVTIPAAYTKNGEAATLPNSDELLADLRRYVADKPAREPIFALRPGKGAKMLRHDLSGAKIPYRDAGGLVFDFHSLRCELATQADAAGISPRVVQRMMRHSTHELTGRYTRPRVADIEAAASKLPSLKPDTQRTEAVIMTGTDPGPVSRPATENATSTFVDECNSNGNSDVTANGDRIRSPRLYPLSYGRLC